MSYHLHSKPVFDLLAFVNGEEAVPVTGEPSLHSATTDHAIDAALRGVPLPDGLLTRLGKLVYTMSDEAADQVDWLGC
ncbi:MAG: hypothetical protein L0228_10935 [Planctomycetes bacterium]|nr:hypothetical protein [Planctomycetota bacterium]